MDDDDLRRDIYNASYDRQADRDWDALIMVLLGVGFLAMALFAGAGWLDHEFGWHLQAWLREHLHFG